MNVVSNLIVDSSSIDRLKNERLFLEAKIEILYAANKRLFQSLDENYDERQELSLKFESLEYEHSLMLGKANDRIMEIRQDTGSRRSGTSRGSSQISRSHKSKESLVAVGRDLSS